MFRWTTRCIPWLGIVLCALIAADARAQGTGSNAKVITWNPANSGETYVGILGEIAKPGVYRVEGPFLTLKSVVRRAGGLTDEASGSIRVIRQDRIVERTFFTTQSDSPLLAGDLLVVESKRTQAAIVRMYDSPPQLRPQYEKEAAIAVRGSDPTGVQVAFVNVLDRPVIVKIKHEHAQLSRVVQMLAQPVELAESVRVIGPERLLSQGAATQPVQASLSDGSVLIFPRNAVNRNKLPTLPIPYDSEIASGALPSLIGGPSGQSAELRNVGQLPPLMSRGWRDSMQTAQPPATLDQARIPAPIQSANPIDPPTGERLDNPSPSNQMPLVSTPPRIATLPFSGQPRISSSSQLSTGPDTEPTEPAAQGRDLNHKPLAGNSNATSSNGAAGSKGSRSALTGNEELDEDADLDSANAGKASSFSLMHMLGIVACVGLLIGLALLTRRHFDRQVAPPAGVDSPLESAEQHNQQYDQEPHQEHDQQYDQSHDQEHEQQYEQQQQQWTASAELPMAAEATELLADVAAISPPGSLLKNVGRTPRPSEFQLETTDEVSVPRLLQKAANLPADATSISSTGAESATIGTLQADAPSAAAWFDQLLGNTLPIREERPEFPPHIILQGRIIAPPVYRVDQAVTRPLEQGPHFAISQPMDQVHIPAKSVSKPETEEIIHEEEVIDEFDDSHSSRPDKPHFLRRRAGEKTVAAAAAAKAKSSQSVAPAATELKHGSSHSTTPVTDALRHLQGGQP